MSSYDKILQVSLDLFIDKGLQSTSTKHILEAANTSTGALYHHFSNKDEIAVALYHSLRSELVDSLYKNTIKTTQFRDFLWKYWFTTIDWSINNPRKKLYMEMYAQLPAIRESCPATIDEKLRFIAQKVDDAINLEIILVPDCKYLLYTFNNTIDAVMHYLREEPDSYSGDFIKWSFNKYWRSIANF